MKVKRWAFKANEFCFSLLTPNQKAVWNLCLVQKIPRKEVAEKLGCTVNAVERRIADAKRKMIKYLSRIRDYSNENP